MKTFLNILLLFLITDTKAQTRHFTIEKKQDGITKVYDGKIQIAEYIENQSAKTGIILNGYTQQKDPLGKYITVFIFSSPDNISLKNVHFTAKFGSPVLNAKFWEGTSIGNAAEDLNPEKNEYHLIADDLHTSTFKLLIVSKENGAITFSGIDGASE